MSGTQLIAESLIEVIVKNRELTVNTLRALRDYVGDESGYHPLSMRMRQVDDVLRVMSDKGRITENHRMYGVFKAFYRDIFHADFPVFVEEQVSYQRSGR